MINVKDLIVKPIKSSAARDFVKSIHYSGKVVANSNLNLGVFYQDNLYGVMQFGSPINKKGTIKIIEGTQWNEMLELNRMAFADFLPKNSESRSMAIAFKLIKKRYPHIKWIVSFADGTQCGDGTIYRASGFLLTDIRESDALRINPETGLVMHVIQAHHLMITKKFKSWKKTEGYQLRYVKLLYPELIKRLTCPIIPYSDIEKMGARMYKGKKICVSSADSGTVDNQSIRGGASPTDTLQNNEVANVTSS